MPYVRTDSHRASDRLRVRLRGPLDGRRFTDLPSAGLSGHGGRFVKVTADELADLKARPIPSVKVPRRQDDAAYSACWKF